jgi:hypothetical protein
MTRYKDSRTKEDLELFGQAVADEMQNRGMVVLRNGEQIYYEVAKQIVSNEDGTVEITLNTRPIVWWTH